ncbi:hypothetical protein BZG36_01610 [Bifiguratus adelaidae]|uniref:Long-chain-fatty-acid--CoA ligase n=1 Tax=Bifiguratus adelaidae TaxID=1938954 RepID=A0A261Y4B6_9FUNG|nr:hypothetical protein BZG36_01610 [Bifiguratus adelaidae]
MVQYTLPVAGAQQKAGETVARRHANFPELVAEPEGVYTAWDGFLNGCKVSGTLPCLGVRPIVDGIPGPYEWQTYNEVRDRCVNFGKGLTKLGLAYQESVGFYAVNRKEWTMGELACYAYGNIIVALYDTLGVEAFRFIVNQTSMKFVLCSADKLDRILSIREEIPSIKTVICMDEGVDVSIKERAKAADIAIYTFVEVENMGKSIDIKSGLAKGTDIATICYTSGTTGEPKGAVLTHRNAICVANAVAVAGDGGYFADISNTDIYISYLPLAHVLERTVQTVMLYKGASIGYYQGDTAKLMDDIAELKPTIFVSVPRLFNRVYDRILGAIKAKGGVSAFLFWTAFNAKKANLARNHLTHWIWDRVVFGQIKQRLGGRVRFMLSGSAPIAPDVLDFLRICFSAEVFEGYGQTENYCGSCLTVKHDFTAGVVGAPFPCSEIKLVDVPDMDYTSQDKPYPRGEICIRGNANMREYYKNPAKTAETIDEDGWLHTGDIGMWDECGRLKIIDRLKNIFKLAQGEYIAPEKIEGVYQKHELVAQAFVHGDSLQSTLVGVVHPDKETLEAWAKENDELASQDFKQLCENPTVKRHLLKSMTAFGKQNDLKGFEQVKEIHLISEEFSVENDLLTPTFKLKRDVAKKRYQKEIDDMYKKLGESQQ